MRIKPHCPEENVPVERAHRSLSEVLDALSHEFFDANRCWAREWAIPGYKRAFGQAVVEESVLTSSKKRTRIARDRSAAVAGWPASEISAATNCSGAS